MLQLNLWCVYFLLWIPELIYLQIFRICRRKTFCHVRAFSFLPFFYITRITSLYENTYENENNTTVVLSSTLMLL